MKRTKTSNLAPARLIGLCTLVAVIVGCSPGKSNKNLKTGVEGENTNAPVVKALPFSIESAVLNNAFRNKLTLGTVDVGVSGGSPAEWAATGIAIAERVANLGANSVEVSVLRNEITERTGTQFREGAHVYFSPDVNRSVDGDRKQWLIKQADGRRLSKQQDVDTTEEYYKVYRMLTDQGLSDDAADSRATKAVVRKYELKENWRLPFGNQFIDVSRDAMRIDVSSSNEGLNRLSRCLKVIDKSDTPRCTDK